MASKTQITVPMEAELIAVIDEMAKERNKSRADIIRESCRFFLDSGALHLAGNMQDVRGVRPLKRSK